MVQINKLSPQEPAYRILVFADVLSLRNTVEVASSTTAVAQDGRPGNLGDLVSLA